MKIKNNPTHVLGIINVTPDSFSDGGAFFNHQKAIDRGHVLMEEGADLLDIGGESTRPGAQTISLAEEIDRILPVVEELSKHYPVSVDTQKTAVMKEVLRYPIAMINDVNALQDEGAVELLAPFSDVKVVLMHQQKSLSLVGAKLLSTVRDFLNTRIHVAVEKGISMNRIIADPGMGFHKNADQNLALLPHLMQLAPSECSVMLGISRKRMFASWLGCDAIEDRILPSVTMAVLAAQKGVQYLRVHDVLKTKQALQCLQVFFTKNERVML